MIQATIRNNEFYLTSERTKIIFDIMLAEKKRNYEELDTLKEKKKIIEKKMQALNISY